MPFILAADDSYEVFAADEKTYVQPTKPGPKTMAQPFLEGYIQVHSGKIRIGDQIAHASHEFGNISFVPLCDKDDLDEDFDVERFKCVLRKSNTEIVEINMGDVNIQFIDTKGDPVTKGTEARKNGWICNIPGVDPTRIKSVEIPKLAYDETGLLTIKVEVYTNEFWDAHTITTCKSCAHRDDKEGSDELFTCWEEKNATVIDPEPINKRIFLRVKLYRPKCKHYKGKE